MGLEFFGITVLLLVANARLDYEDGFSKLQTFLIEQNLFDCDKVVVRLTLKLKLIEDIVNKYIVNHLYSFRVFLSTKNIKGTIFQPYFTERDRKQSSTSKIKNHKWCFSKTNR